MKIFIPFKERAIGGTSVFVRKFTKALEKKGYEVVFTFCKDYDILFVMVDCPLYYVLHAKKNKKKIVQRLDGCYYPTVSGTFYYLYNLKAKLIHNYFADYVIYQSKYSQTSCERFLGKTKALHTIIYNGVASDVFSPKGKKAKVPNKKILFTASRFRREDQILPLLVACDTLYKKRKDFQFLVAGTFTDNLHWILQQKRSYVTFLGKIPNETLPSYERASDIFLQTHLNPPCPNNIIEALSICLPVCGMNDGAMSELVVGGKTGELLPVEGDGYFIPRVYDTDAIAQAINKILNNKQHYVKELNKVRKNYDINIMLEQYLAVFDQLQAK